MNIRKKLLHLSQMSDLKFLEVETIANIPEIELIKVNYFTKI